MNQEKIVVSSGVKHIPVFLDEGVDTGRSVDFNPTDQGFAEDLYGLVTKISQIHDESNEKQEIAKKSNDITAMFDIRRKEDTEIREAFDSMFGNGFCNDVFRCRMFAMVDGMTVAENFCYSLLDEMDASITDNIAARDARIKRYTEKYSKYSSAKKRKK